MTKTPFRNAAADGTIADMFRMTGYRSYLSQLLFVVLGLCAAGCEGGSGLNVWAVSEMAALTDRVEPYKDLSILAEDNETVRLFAAANETVSFQLVIDAPSGKLDSVSVNTAGLGGQRDPKRHIAAEHVSAFRMLPVAVEQFPAWYLRLAPAEPQPANYYDALVPIDTPQTGKPYRLGNSKRLALWVDIAVPRTAQSDVYKGTVDLDLGRLGRRSVKLELKVYPFVLPSAQPLAAVGGFDHGTLFRRFIRRGGKAYDPVRLDPKVPEVQQGLEKMRQMMVLAHRHRLYLFDKRLRPKISRDLHGKLRLDWRTYDTIVKPYLSGEAFADGNGTPAWPIPFSEDWPVPKYYGGIGAPAYNATASEIIAKCGRHFRSLGAEEQMFAWPYRQAVRPEAFRQFIRLAGIIKKTDRGIPILSRLPTTPPAETGWKVPAGFALHVDILAPPAQWLDPRTAAGLKSPRNPLLGVWLSPGQPPYMPGLSVLASPADVRSLPWIAMKYHCTGLFLPEVLNWSGDVFAGSAGAQTRLFYPGNKIGIDGVLPSVRLKRLRRGLQDIAYLWILRQRGREDLADAILSAMVRYAGLAGLGDHYLDPHLDGWVERGEIWIEARQILAEKVLQTIQPPAPSPNRKAIERVKWQRFISQTSQLRVERIQAFMRAGELPLAQFTPPDEDNRRGLRATILVELFNEFGHAVNNARVQVGHLPPGWKAIIGEYIIPRFPAGARLTAKLVIEGTDLPIFANGRIPVSVEISADNNPARMLKTEVAFVVAGAAGKPPVIDGKLDDWPRRPRASAGDFRLLGRRGLQANGLARRQTLVFTMQDDKNLYFAFRCRQPEMENILARPNNRVQYQQLLACGEDLVELLLDPGASAASPEDLYHIVVKPNGIMIQEKGIGCQPPLGASGRVNFGAEVAVGRSSREWIVELKIPRSAFGRYGRAEFWGVNFIRFATAGAEASSWAGAQRYYYDPRNLGTMFVNPPTKP